MQTWAELQTSGGHERPSWQMEGELEIQADPHDALI